MGAYSPATLPPVDTVDIVSLRDVYANRIDQYMRSSAGAPTVAVDGEEAQRVAALWRELQPGEQARCHTPPYGLRFYSGGHEVLQASICWECHNIYGEAKGEAIDYEFDGAHYSSKELLVALRRATGDPESA